MSHHARSRIHLPVPTARSGHDLLGIYLNDHLTGATVGTERSRHLAEACRGSEIGDAIAPLADEIAEDRRTLVGIMRRLGIPVRRYKVYAGLLGERFGRLKSNGALVRRSPLSSLLELELLQVGVEGKVCLWETLRKLADRDTRLDPRQLDGLLERARRQLGIVEDVRGLQAGQVFAH
ncbi:hypothetical protein [Streptomyces thermoalcalitolerans]|uniref:Uncharacterized protein n=1 Tax=Streptomyces thermoalcalitolerans TaxID=65605 RepID=A0ABN1PE33_9ACTN